MRNTFSHSKQQKHTCFDSRSQTMHASHVRLPRFMACYPLRQLLGFALGICMSDARVAHIGWPSGK